MKLIILINNKYVFTFLFYFLFSNLFDFFESYIVGKDNVG